MKNFITILLALFSTLAFGTGQNLSTRINIGLANGLTTSYQSSATFNALAGYNYQVNTTSVAITATLPNGSINAQTQFVDDQGTWGTNNLTICPNGSQTIQGITAGSCLVANLSGAFVQLTWDNTNSVWTVTANGFNYDALYSPGSQTGLLPSTGLAGVTNSTSAIASGKVGYVIQQLVTNANIPATVGNITSLSLSAGRWRVTGMACLNGAPTGRTYVAASVTTTSGANGALGSSQVFAAGATAGGSSVGCATVPPQYFYVTSNTTLYLTALSSSAGTGANDTGIIIAEELQ